MHRGTGAYLRVLPRAKNRVGTRKNGELVIRGSGRYRVRDDMVNRTLEEQLEPDKSSRLRIIQHAYESLRVRGRVSSYYIFEISRAIDSGMLLASIELATTLLEIWLRDLLVIRKAMQHSVTSEHEFSWVTTKLDREYEGRVRGVGYKEIVNELVKLKVIDSEERQWLDSLYGELRNPLHHGLSGRLLDPEFKHLDFLGSAKTKEEMFLASLFCSSPDRRSEVFEEYLDNDVMQHLEAIVNFLAAHQISRFV